MYILEVAFYFLLGYVIHMTVSYARRRMDKPVGTIYVDYSDPLDGPYLFLKVTNAEPLQKNHTKAIILIERTNLMDETRN